MITRRTALLWLRGLCLAATAMLFVGALGAQSLESLRGKVTRHRLANGLTFLLLEQRATPTVSFHVYYNVGAVNEQLGQTGVAHLYEHMAFKGTPTIGTRDYQAELQIMEQIDARMEELVAERNRRSPDPDKIRRLQQEVARLQEEQKQYIVENELPQLFERHGAVGLNATTQMDATEYMVSLPANKIELWAALESDRMAHPVLRQFYLERDVVLEERRLRFDTQPFGKLYENFLVHAFVAHPYGTHAGIGWPSDLQNITRRQTLEFFQKYYVPSNTIIAIVGDFQTEELIPLLDRYFSRIPAADPPPGIHTQEPPQEGERRITVEYASQPFLLIGYHRPSLDHPDDVVFDVMENILSSGRTARLYKSLVEQKKVAVQAIASSTAFLTYGKYPTLFLLIGVPLAPAGPEEVEKAFAEEIERLKKEPVSQRELQKTLNQLEAGLLRTLRSKSGLARILAQREALTEGWETLLDVPRRFASVTPEDIQRVARIYFTEKNRTVALLRPPSPDAPPESAEPADPVSAAAGRDLLERVVEAMGGEEAVRRVNSQVFEAEVTLATPQGEQRGTTKSYMVYPDKLRIELAVGVQMTQIVNGDRGWVVFPGATRELPPLLVRQLRSNLGADPLWLLRLALEEGTRLSRQADQEVDGKNFAVLSLETDQDHKYRAYIDPESFHIARIAYTTLNQAGQPAEGVEAFSDYRQVEGLYLPFLLSTYQEGRQFAERPIQARRLNEELDPGLFEQ